MTIAQALLAAPIGGYVRGEREVSALPDGPAIPGSTQRPSTSLHNYASPACAENARSCRDEVCQDHRASLAGRPRGVQPTRVPPNGPPRALAVRRPAGPCLSLNSERSRLAGGKRARSRRYGRVGGRRRLAAGSPLWIVMAFQDAIVNAGWLACLESTAHACERTSGSAGRPDLGCLRVRAVIARCCIPVECGGEFPGSGRAGSARRETRRRSSGRPRLTRRSKATLPPLRPAGNRSSRFGMRKLRGGAGCKRPRMAGTSRQRRGGMLARVSLCTTVSVSSAGG
jgi:hypothetical protein